MKQNIVVQIWIWAHLMVEWILVPFLVTWFNRKTFFSNNFNKDHFNGSVSGAKVELASFLTVRIAEWHADITNWQNDINCLPIAYSFVDFHCYKRIGRKTTCYSHYIAVHRIQLVCGLFLGEEEELSRWIWVVKTVFLYHVKRKERKESQKR